MKIRIILALFALVATLLTGCGGSGLWPGGQDTKVTRIEITPGNVLLTGSGHNKQLTAQAYNAAGEPIAATVAWSSSKPANVDVGAKGLATSHVAVGSAVITASADGVTSAPVLVVVATPVAGAVLVADNQIVGAPELLDPNVVEMEVGVRYTVTLRGIAQPAVGAIVLAAETAPVAGRVVEVQNVNGDWRVTLEVVPLKEYFSDLVIDEELDLANVEPIIPEKIASLYDITREADGKLVFTPKATAAATPAVAVETGKKRAAAAGATPPSTFDLGPFTCESTTTFPLANLFTPSFAITNTLKVIVQKDSRAGGLQRLTVRGGLVGELKNTSTFDAAFEGSIECKAEYMAYPIPLNGPLAALVGGQVPIGMGFKVGGKITAAQVGFEVAGSAGGTIELGIACPGGTNCVGVSDIVPLDNRGVDGTRKWILPPELNDPLSQLKLEPTLFAFAYADFSVGSPLHKKLRATAFGGKIGTALSGSLATPKVQILDPNYQSKYQISVDAVVEATATLKKLCGWLSINPVKLELKASWPLATSPASTKVVTAVETYHAGDVVDFTIVLDPATLDFGAGFANVNELFIYKNGQPDTPIASQAGSPGRNIYTLYWIATEDGSIKDNFTAFVRTNFFPVDAIGTLKLAPAKPEPMTFQIGTIGGAVDTSNKTITVKLPYGADTSALTPSFTVPGTKVTVGDAEQISGVSANNFSSPIPYTITKWDGSSETYMVTVKTMRYLRSFGGPGTGDGQFGDCGFPGSGIAIDADGNIYVSDSCNDRVQKLDANGNFLEKFNQFPTGLNTYGTMNYQAFGLPTTVLIDGSGRVFVTAYSHGYGVFPLLEPIIYYIDGLKYRVQFGSGSYGPVYSAINSSGHVYIASTDNNFIIRHDPVEQRATCTTCFIKWGTAGSGDGQFKGPRGIAIDSSGNVYIADTGNNRIQKFDADGGFIAAWTKRGNTPYDYPRSIAIDGSDNVYVTDQYGSFGNGQVYVLNKDGQHISTLSHYPSQYLTGITTDRAGNVYVYNEYTSQIDKFGYQ